METIHTLQLLTVVLGALFFLASFITCSFSRSLNWISLGLNGVFGLSLLITQPPAHSCTLALQRAFPAMSAELAYQITTCLIAPVIGALLCIAIRIVWPGVLKWLSRLMLLLAHVGLIQLLLVLCLCLASCKPKPAQTTTTPVPVPPVDATRQTLQRQANASRAGADQASQSSQSSLTNYERDVKAYDSIQVKLR